jgi:hypothetical protein
VKYKMKKAAENIREAEIEDALVANLDNFKEMLCLEKEMRFISRQLRLIDGKNRLDILLAVGNEILLVELKATKFQSEYIKQILTYKEELIALQQEKNLISGKIVPILLVTGFTEQDLKICEGNGVCIYEYSPVDVLTKYYEKVASIAKFMRIRPVDLGVFNIGLINRVMTGLENGFTTTKEISEFGKLSVLSVTHHLKFAIELGLVAQRKNRYYLTDLGLRYISLGEELLTRDELSDEQATLLRNYIAKDPFSSPIVFGIYTIVESAFFLARNTYPVDFAELKDFFLITSGKKYEWQAPKSLSTATYTYLNYSTKLGLLGKIGQQIVITPAGFRFILMLQLHKSIEMVESLSSEPNR